MLPSGSFKTKLSLSGLVKVADSVQISVPLVVKENHLISVLTFCPLNSRNEEEIIATNPPLEIFQDLFVEFWYVTLSFTR